MITDLLIWILIAICTGLVLWGIKQKERMYQYPFIMGGMFFVFIIPQAISLVNHVSGTSTPVSAVQRVLIMSCLCALSSWVGYLIPIPVSWLQRNHSIVDEKRLKNISLIYVFIGTAFSLLIVNLPNEYGTKVTGISTGIFTVYTFFLRGFLNTGFPLLIIEYIKRPSVKNCLLAIIAIAIPFYQAFFLGRRSGAALLLLSMALVLYFIRRVLPSRLIAIIAIVVALLTTISIKEYRQFLINQDWTLLSQTNPIENLQRLISDEGSVLELRNAALFIDFTAEHNSHGWGSFYWDRIVFYFVPGQFLGSGFKSSLQLGIGIGGNDIANSYGYFIPPGSTLTGIGEAFIQFDYLGCLLFALTGILCKWLWYRALLWNNPIEQTIYINLILGATVGVLVTGHSFLIANIISILIFTSPISLFTSVKNHRQSQLTYELIQTKQIR